MNAAFNGRPVLMHERDMGMDIFKIFQLQTYPCFRVLLEVVSLLDQVIQLYRPSNLVPADLENGFPSFEQVVVDSRASQAPTALLGKKD